MTVLLYKELNKVNIIWNQEGIGTVGQRIQAMCSRHGCSLGCGLGEGGTARIYRLKF
jgi:hypothetical protein